MLIINADDFGFTSDVNEGIVESHRQGILTSTTLMANGAAFEEAAALAAATPTLAVGAHLTVVGGRSVRNPNQALPASLAALVAAVLRGGIPLYEEFAAQIRKIRTAGVPITHLDTHKHAHLLPPVALALARVSREFGIPWVRRPLYASGLGSISQRILSRAGCRMTDRFEGYSDTGRLSEERLIGVLRNLSAGSTELMCHPGYLREELAAARTRLKQQRRQELAALTSPKVRRVIEEAGIRVTDYRRLAAGER